MGGFWLQMTRRMRKTEEADFNDFEAGNTSLVSEHTVAGR